MQNFKSPELKSKLEAILGQYSAQRQTDSTIWQSMSNEARYGKLLEVGCNPMDADKYALRDMALIPEPYFHLLMGNVQ